MKRICMPLAVFLLMASCQSPVKGKNGVVYKSAVQYNDYIVKRQTQIIEYILDFAKVSQTDLDSAGRILDLAVNEMDKLTEEIRGMPPFKKDTALRNSAVSIFTFYKTILADDYRQIIEIRKKGTGITEDDLNRMNEIVENIARSEEKYDKKFQLAQRNFAKKNGFKLADNEMQKRIKELSSD
jgi:hypothetical protein